jgi:purine-cytosine permease-like protein
MELDDLKNTWKQVTEAENLQYEVSVTELNRIIKQRSSSLTEKMLRSFYGEIGILVLGILAMGISPFPWYFRLSMVSTFALLLIPFLKPFARFYHVLRNFSQLPVEDLHRTLHRQVEMLRQYLHWYRRMNLILTPIAGFGVIWGLLYVYWLEQLITKLSSTILWVTFGLSVSYALLCIPFVNWYINKLYGHYLEKLSACLEELEEKNH